MEARLYELIRDFQAAVSTALATFLARANLADPFAWRAAGLPRTGELEGQPRIRYAFHGGGLRLALDDDVIDFDFGFDGRTSGFTDWWLREFALARPSRYPEYVVDPTRIARAFDDAKTEGMIDCRVSNLTNDEAGSPGASGGIQLTHPRHSSTVGDLRAWSGEPGRRTAARSAAMIRHR